MGWAKYDEDNREAMEERWTEKRSWSAVPASLPPVPEGFPGAKHPGRPAGKAARSRVRHR